MAQGNHDILVYIFQRGAADGLNAVVPHGDADYYGHRPNINVPLPGQTNGAIDLDGFFGLHPALTPIKPIYDAGDLALVHATGVPHGTRSHFDAQALIERGIVDKSGPLTGWLGRHLATTSSTNTSAFRTVAISGNVPVSLKGADEPLAINKLGDYGFKQEIIDAGFPDILATLFHSAAPMNTTAQAALSALDELQAANPTALTPENGASYPGSDLGDKLKQAGQLIKSTLPVEVICLDADGWDHHESLPTYIDASLGDLAASLEAFHTDMGTRMQNITVLVHTEFGRRVAENGSQGADHGTGSLAYLMGGGVNGGQVIGSWPGLATADLELGEDLKITTDLRTVMSELLSKRLGGSDLASVFPDFAGPDTINAFIS